jgi:hypothetical protein
MRIGDLMHKLTIMLDDKIGTTVEMSDKDLKNWVRDPYWFIELFIKPCILQIANEITEHEETILTSESV